MTETGQEPKRNAVGWAIVVCGALLALSVGAEWGRVRQVGYSGNEAVARTV
jgi:hypothetical protein